MMLHRLSQKQIEALLSLLEGGALPGTPIPLPPAQAWGVTTQALGQRKLLTITRDGLTPYCALTAAGAELALEAAGQRSTAQRS